MVVELKNRAFSSSTILNAPFSPFFSASFINPGWEAQVLRVQTFYFSRKLPSLLLFSGSYPAFDVFAGNGSSENS